MVMERDELQRYLDVSIAHSVTVDIEEVGEAPGCLRSITIHRDGRVTIEFQRCGEYLEGDFEGGGLKYVGKYPSIDDAIADLENYLSRPLAAWRNYTCDPHNPLRVAEPDPEANTAYFEGLVRNGAMRLPHGGDFQLAGIYWRHIQRYGEYRRDKLQEEQDLNFRERGILVDDDDDDDDVSE
jgi:hypothetical protein